MRIRRIQKIRGRRMEKMKEIIDILCDLNRYCLQRQKTLLNSRQTKEKKA
ncbi:unnamed protein product [Arabidopsis lyrata]|nr:unnamed protein product [Arabidopsis lyrata]